jgi:signal transduction histidine kinase
MNVTSPRVRRLSWWDGSVLNLLGDATIAALAWPLGWKAVQSSRIGLIPYGWGTTVVVATVAVALLVRRRFPVTTALVAIVATVGSAFWIPVPLATYTAASRRGNTPVTWLVAAGCAVAVAVPWGVGFDQREPVFSVAFFAVALVGFPVLLGLWVAQRRQLVAGLRDRTAQAERERDLRAAQVVAEERTRIARELHDVVAHRVSQIAVQAGALSVASDGHAAEIAETIRGTSTTALEEMRELLGVLRHGADTPPLHPAPGLAGLRFWWPRRWRLVSRCTWPCRRSRRPSMARWAARSTGPCRSR